jgi:hypothetical protein
MRPIFIREESLGGFCDPSGGHCGDRGGAANKDYLAACRNCKRPHGYTKLNRNGGFDPGILPPAHRISKKYRL